MLGEEVAIAVLDKLALMAPRSSQVTACAPSTAGRRQETEDMGMYPGRVGLALSVLVVASAAAVPPGHQPPRGCEFRCNLKGYVISAVQDGPSGSSKHIVRVEVTDIVQYMTADEVVRRWGSVSPRPSQVTVRKVETAATVASGRCDAQGFPLTGVVYEVSQRNPYNLRAGAVELHDADLCLNADIQRLVTVYNAHVDRPDQAIPDCGFEGCRPPPDPVKKEGISGPTGFVAAEFEGVEERDEATPGEARARCGAWTRWFNVDGPGGKGDYEMLAELKGRGRPCGVPTAIECVTATNEAPWKTTKQPYHCEAGVGGYCVNAEQPGGSRCQDYKVRFCCDSP